MARRRGREGVAVALLCGERNECSEKGETGASESVDGRATGEDETRRQIPSKVARFIVPFSLSCTIMQPQSNEEDLDGLEDVLE
jgi:hypothetical protein